MPESLPQKPPKSLIYLNEDNAWAGSFNNLVKYHDDGTEYVYTVSEDKVTGYTTTYGGSMADGLKVTNTHTPITITIPVSKVWSDDDDWDKIRPASVIIHLYNEDGDTGKFLELKADGWTGSFENIDKYASGKEIVYKLIENSVSGYTMTSTGSAATGFVVTNTHQSVGDLTISKKVDGNDCDKTKLFHFTLTLDDTSVNGTYGDLAFTNGVANFNLADGVTVTVKGLNHKLGYTVTEQDYSTDGYVASMTGEKGFIIGKSTVAAEFTNTRNTYGDLGISKAVAGNDCDKTKEFVFTITLGDTSINGTYGDLDFINGVATCALSDGKYALAMNLPNGVTYKVTEADYSEDGYVTTFDRAEGTVVGNSSIMAAFTNTRDTFGSLSVTKVVNGNSCDKNKEFAFTVSLGDLTINGTYGDMDFIEGVAKFNLKDGETRTAVGLANGLVYHVFESDYSDDGYVTTFSDEAGQVIGNGAKTASFTNTKDTYGNLVITNTVQGNDCDKNKDFEYTITLDDPSVNGTYGDVTFTDGVGTFSLKDGENVSVIGLPNGVAYTVTETDYTADGYGTTFNGETGTIVSDETQQSEFVNEKNTYGDLVITNTVTGNGADPNKEFSFTVTLDDPSINGTYGDVTFTDGVATFELKDGQSVSILGLPNGVSYKVVETDYSADGYTTTFVKELGTIVGGQTIESDWVNERNVAPEKEDTPSAQSGATQASMSVTAETASPKTADDTNPYGCVILLLIAMAGAATAGAASKIGRKAA